MDKSLFTLWIWPEDRDFEAEEAIRAALRNHGFEWEERVEYVCDRPAVLDTGMEELGYHDIDINKHLDLYTISDAGELLLDGKTADEMFAIMFKSYDLTSEAILHLNDPDDDSIEEAVIWEANLPDDK